MNGSLFKKGLVSLAAAGLLASSASAVDTRAADGVIDTSTESFSTVIDTTTVTKGNCAYLTLTLLDADGKIDTINGGNVEKVVLNVSSILGTVYEGFTANGQGGTAKTEFKTTDAPEFSNGVAKVSVCYPSTAKLGTDTITVYGYVDELGSDTDVLTLGTVKKNVEVTETSNQATYLAIDSLAAVNTIQGQVAGDYDYEDDSETDGKIYVGQPFNVNIKAYIYSASGSTTTTSQNGTVTLDFYRDDNASEGTPYATVTGTMTNGLATISVPEDTITKADNFYMIASMDTGAKTSSGDYVASNYKDSNSSNYVNEVEQFEAMALTTAESLMFKVNGSTSRDSINMFVQASEEPIEKVELCAADKYGNTVSSLSAKIPVTLTATNKIVAGQTSTTFDIETSSVCYTVTSTNDKIKMPSTSTDLPSLSSTTYSATDVITATSSTAGVASDTLNVNMYKFGAVVVAEDNASVSRNSFKNSVYTAGTVNGDDAGEGNFTVMVVHNRDGLMKWADGNASTATSDINSSSTIESGSALVATVETYEFTAGSDNDANQTQTWKTTATETLSNLTVGNATSDANQTQIRFKKAGNFGLKVSLAAATSHTGTNYRQATYMPYRSDDVALLIARENDAYTDASTNDLNVTVAAAGAVDGALSVVKYTSADAYTGAEAAYSDASAITIKTTNTNLSTAYDANISFGSYNYKTGFVAYDANKTYTDMSGSSYSGAYYLVKFADEYGNALDSAADIVFTTSSDGLTPSQGLDAAANGNSGWAAYASSTTYNLTNATGTTAVAGFAYDKVGTDTISVTNTSMGVAGTSVAVTVEDATTSVASIALTAPDYMLTNSSNVISISAKDQNGKAITATGLLLTVSNVNMISMEGNDSTAISNGTSLTDNSTADLKPGTTGTVAYRLSTSNTAGEVTITVKNSAGTVTGTKTINIVSKQSDMPATAATIALNSGETSVNTGATSELVIKVTDESGNAVPSKQVTVTSDNESVATITATATTDSNGLATFTITGGSITGVAKMTFAADSATGNIDVTVLDAASSASSVDEIAAAIDTLTTENGGTWTVAGYFYNTGSGAWDWSYCMSGTCYQLTGFDAATGYFNYAKDTDGNYVTTAVPAGDYAGSFVNYGTGAFDWAYVAKGYEDQNYKLGGNADGIDWGALTGLNASVSGESVTFTK